MKTNNPSQSGDEKKIQTREETVVIGIKPEKLVDEAIEEAEKKKKDFRKSAGAYAAGAAAIVGGAVLGSASDEVDVIATPGEPVADNADLEFAHPEDIITPEEAVVDVQEEAVPKESAEAVVKPEENIVPEEENVESVEEEPAIEPETVVEVEPQVDEIPQEEQNTEITVEEETVVEPGEPLNDEEVAQKQEDTEIAEIQDTDIADATPNEERPQEDLAEAIVSPGLQVDNTNIQDVITPIPMQPFQINPTPLEIELTGLGSDADSQMGLFIVNEQTTFDNGESQNAAVSITNKVTGEDFMLVDSDGDGIYDSVYDADGGFVEYAGGSIKEDDIREMIASHEDMLGDTPWDVMHPHYDMAASADELIYSDDNSDQPDEIEIDDSMLG